MNDYPSAGRWPIATLLGRFMGEDDGQDAIEYALIAGFIGIAGILALEAIEGTVFDTYSSWIDPSAGTPSLWAPNEPPP